ncbi:hypothetical protein HGG75_25930 [Ochrobactrum pseudogrignonense]|uniref:hypothetical protein n=1 Tax=Brucella pseudogrignonensis TaxID=419475 RepID=UPI0015C60C9F|nr:hypothetical protein [Brucella pseudogrignonensis]NKX16678.1 hypothetical protein [Brucella pseudogrignonensis]NKX17303.1 hypothetical protein [Brucella pseudogrignonensis]
MSQDDDHGDHGGGEDCPAARDAGHADGVPTARVVLFRQCSKAPMRPLIWAGLAPVRP